MHVRSTGSIFSLTDKKEAGSPDRTGLPEQTADFSSLRVCSFDR